MMKKSIKKLLASLLAVAMLCAMAVPALAVSNTHTLTINGTTSGHTYEAYQVFAGKLAENGVLSDITFGTGVDGAALLADTNLPSELKGKASAAELASALVGKENDSELLNEFAKVISMHLDTVAGTSTSSTTTYTISGLADGYYFIKDATVRLPNGATYSRYMLNIVTNLAINAKDTTVTLDKQIKHNETDDWGVVGDNQIGDTVEFRTITTVPDTTGYTSYTYEIHDTMSSELTSNVKGNNDITIKVNGTNVLDSTYYSVTVDTTNSNKFTVKVKIIDAVTAGVLHANDKLYTYYTGVLNENAKVYPDGPQQNEAHLVYSNNPNDTSTGETVHKTVYDWTFQIDVTKVDGTTPDKKLEGAVFVLSKSADLVLKPEDNGTPTEHTDDLIKLVKKSEGVYTVADASTSTTYTMTTPATGQISIKGLDDDTTYYLYETKAPSGYNSLTAPVTFKIATRTNDNYSDTGVTINEQPNITVNGNPTLSGTAFNVENNAGTTLPSTGGIGTTIFYVLGSILVIGAVVLLITKKRMSAAA